MNDETLKRVISCIQELLLDYHLELDILPSSQLKVDLTLDSLDIAMLIEILDDEFKVRLLKNSKLPKWITVQDVVDTYKDLETTE